MSLDVTLTAVRPTSVFSANITHNLGKMATEAGIHEALWRPEEIGVSTAAQLIPLLEIGLEKMKSDPEKFIALEPWNKWGAYNVFVPWIEEYLKACKENPDAEISVYR